MSERAQGVEDADATVVLPTPGKRRSAFAPSIDRQAAAADLAALGGLNPLVEAANPILAAVPQIRHALRHPDPAGLRERLREQIDGFARSAAAAGIQEHDVETARFALCALLDDSAAATPWGRDWVDSGLAMELLREPNAGERFFQLVDDLLRDAERNRSLVEFFSICLALGFEGRYRSGEGGRQALAQVRSRLFAALEQRTGTAQNELAIHWRGENVRPPRVPDGVAVAAAACACAMVLAGVYFAYSVLLGAFSDPVARDLATLKAPLVAGAPPHQPERGARALPVTVQLAKSIGRDADVADAADGTVILLKSDHLFAPGSARPEARVAPVLQRIATALDAVPGAIVVTGHTDDQPIRTSRYPSNWELSTERARSVVSLLAVQMKNPRRVHAEGLADSQPVAPNDTPENRAKNRRVEIIVRGGT